MAILHNIGYRILFFSFLVTVGYIHYHHVKTLHENVYTFSHLSTTEREMTLLSEQGFYFSFYKRLITENPFVKGVVDLMNDKLVEHPNEINSFSKFNIYPEFLIAMTYRYVEPIINTTKYHTCHMVDRGPAFEPVISCVGLSEPIYFYLEVVWILSGLYLTTLAAYAGFLSGSIFGSLLTTLLYLSNHGESTRVMYHPMLRESFAQPLIVLQMMLVSAQLRKNTSVIHLIGTFLSLCGCLMFWQFSQFVLLTQLAILFLMEQFRIIESKKFFILLHTHFCGIHFTILLLQGSDMLKTSLYVSLFSVLSVYSILFSTLQNKVVVKKDLFFRVILIVVRIILVVFASLYLRMFLGDAFKIDEDSHILDLLKAKFTNFTSFHSKLYLCGEPFQFLSGQYFWNITESGLLPIVCLVLTMQTYTWFGSFNKVKAGRKRKKCDEKKSENAKKGSDLKDVNDVSVKEDISKSVDALEKLPLNAKQNSLDYIENVLLKNDDKICVDPLVESLSKMKVDPCVVYNLAQMCVFGLMSLLVMRLKMLFTPQLCLIASLIFSNNRISSTKLFKAIAIFLTVIVLYNGKRNIENQLSLIGDFREPHLESLLEWIENKTTSWSAFAGPMATMATVALATGRPIANHPHYEHKMMRDRTYNVYKVYGRIDPEEMFEILNALKVTFLIVDKSQCGRRRNGCSYTEMMDLEEQSGPPLCERLLSTEIVPHLYPVFHNPQYAVFRVNEYSVNYSPNYKV